MFSVLISIMGCILSGTISARGIEPPPVLDPSLIKKLERRIDRPVEKSSLKEFPSVGLTREFVSEEDEFGGSKDESSVSNENSRAAEQKKIADEKIHLNKRLLTNSFKNRDQTNFQKPKTAEFNQILTTIAPSGRSQQNVMKDSSAGQALGARKSNNSTLSNHNNAAKDSFSPNHSPSIQNIQSNGVYTRASLRGGSFPQKKNPQENFSEFQHPQKFSGVPDPKFDKR